MIETLPSIEFLGLRACSVRIKGCHSLKWGTCSYSNTEQQYSIVARQRTSVGFKLAVRGDTGAGGLELPLHVQHTSVSKLYRLAVPCHSKCRPSPFVLISQYSLT